MNTLAGLIFTLFAASTVSAAGLKSLMLFYDEFEVGVGAQSMRYLINDQYIRIDNGDEQSDFILFDVKAKNIYSINHEDKTILTIEQNNWEQPPLHFKVSEHVSLMKDAPSIYNQPVYHYQLKADQKVCTQVYLIKNTFPDEMKIMHQYQQVLSGQQVATLGNTPGELQTPCFLIDQVYHSGDYYQQGLPIQVTYSRGYEKLLKDFKETEVDMNLFKLPVKYVQYKAINK